MRERMNGSRTSLIRTNLFQTTNGALKGSGLKDSSELMKKLLMVFYELEYSL